MEERKEGGKGGGGEKHPQPGIYQAHSILEQGRTLEPIEPPTSHQCNSFLPLVNVTGFPFFCQNLLHLLLLFYLQNLPFSTPSRPPIIVTPQYFPHTSLLPIISRTQRAQCNQEQLLHISIKCPCWAVFKLPFPRSHPIPIRNLQEKENLHDFKSSSGTLNIQ